MRERESAKRTAMIECEAEAERKHEREYAPNT